MRFATVFWIAPVCATVSACAGNPTPPPSPQLAPPESRLMLDCGDLPAIPEGDGDPMVRRTHYAEVRGQFAICRDRHRGLRQYVDTIRR